MRILIAAGVFAGVLAAAGAVGAQPLERPGADGRVTLEELQSRAQARFARLDVNGDGTLTRQEAQEARQRLRAERVQRRFGEDGVLTREEARAGADARFARLDADRDGRLTPEEAQAARGDGMRMMRAGRRGRMGAVRLGRMMGADGELTLAEMQGVIAQRFQRMDRDGDGALTASDRQGRRGGRGRG